jgi:hypothetical protein
MARRTGLYYHSVPIEVSTGDREDREYYYIFHRGEGMWELSANLITIMLAKGSLKMKGIIDCARRH